MQSSFAARPKLLQGLATGFTAALLALILWTTGTLERWEGRTWDWRVTLLAQPVATTDEIRVILLDQNSLDWGQQENALSWPWPREMYTAIINFCQRGGARSLAFDVLFSEPSIYGVADDQVLGEQIATFNHFAGAAVFGRTSGSQLTWPSELTPPAWEIQGLTEWAAQQTPSNMFLRAGLPISEVAANVALLANVQLAPDADAVYRRVHLFGLFDQHAIPTLGTASYLARHPQTPTAIAPERLQMTVQGVPRDIPIDADGRTILRFRGPSGTHQAVSAAAVIQSEIRLLHGEEPVLAPDFFKDKYVFFGFSAPGLFDLRPTPVGGLYPGVEIHATLLDNLLAGDFIQATPAWVQIMLLLGLCLGAGLLLTFFSAPLAVSSLSLLFLAIPIGLSLLFYQQGYWLELVFLELGLTGGIALTLVANFATQGKQKRFLKNAFQQYLSPDVIEQIIQHPDRLKLGGERKELSIFFSDLQGFTSISEGLDPEQLTSLLNEYLTAMTDIIHQTRGTVDKYEGDAIIAFWNAPLDVPGHARQAVSAALQCQRRLAEMRPEVRQRIGKDLLMRIGINTGVAVVGNMGSLTRFDYTMLGDAVNLAARLEGVNKQFGTYTLISASTAAALDHTFALREVARVGVVGRAAPVTVFEPWLEADYAANRDRLARFDEGLRHYYDGNLEAAMAIFEALQTNDAAAAAYLEKCYAMQQNPPDTWDGVWVMTSK